MTPEVPAEIGLTFGTYEEARALVGTRTSVVFAERAVTGALIKYFCAMVRDANASYWDEEYANQQWGGVISPPAMLLTWVVMPEWRPGDPSPAPMLLGRVPLPDPTVISVGTDMEFFVPMRVGDRLNVEETLVDVSPRKTTSLGEGHFLSTESFYRRGDGTPVARYVHDLFRFTPA
ncbi:MAG TPA: MaoC family dehydratase N-terminal domain-containing protein [Acidimicrobiales bacterium]|nr:MaoC family dehydratase N-terminal domain-containing protein [Acidimicrobiales bacterium]